MDRDDGFDDELHYSDEFVSYGSFDDEDEDVPAYDVNRERDKGDSEDIDGEAHEKQHESLRKNAILDIGVGIQQHMSTEISSNTGGNRNRISHKGRGPTKAFRVKEPMYLKFDHLLRPTVDGAINMANLWDSQCGKSI